MWGEGGPGSNPEAGVDRGGVRRRERVDKRVGTRGGKRRKTSVGKRGKRADTRREMVSKRRVLKECRKKAADFIYPWLGNRMKRVCVDQVQQV